MNKRVFEQIEVDALKMYASNLDDNLHIIYDTNKELYSLITERLNNIIDINISNINNEFDRLCDYALSIGAKLGDCSKNNNLCIVEAIKLRVMHLYRSSFIFGIDFKEYCDDLETLNNKIKEEQRRSIDEFYKLSTDI